MYTFKKNQDNYVHFKKINVYQIIVCKLYCNLYAKLARPSFTQSGIPSLGK